MIALGNILYGIGSVLDMLLMTFVLLVFVRAIISWANPDPYNPFVRFLSSSTEPLLQHIRRWTRRFSSTIDLSPIILIVALYFLRFAVAQTLMDYGAQLRSSGFSHSVTIGT